MVAFSVCPSWRSSWTPRSTLPTAGVALAPKRCWDVYAVGTREPAQYLCYSSRAGTNPVPTPRSCQRSWAHTVLVCGNYVVPGNSAVFRNQRSVETTCFLETQRCLETSGV